MNKPTLFTALSPRLLELYSLKDAVVVIIDVFRATSTIATALKNGANCVYPVADVQACIDKGAAMDAVTAGERNGKVIEGLLHGNSPAEYPVSFIKGKTLVLTTTNGTKLLQMALEQGASQVITGSFVNLSSVCKHLLSEKKNVILACSGWKDMYNLEDSLFAGAVADQLEDDFMIHCDSTLMVKEMYRLHKNDIKQFVRQTTHWHRLQAYGLEKDLEFCVTVDAADILPLYHPREEALYGR